MECHLDITLSALDKNRAPRPPSVDRAIGQLAVAAVTPQALEAALAVFEDLRRGQSEAEALYLCQVERAQQDSQLAQRQFLLANPENRLVVDNLEKRWNERLAALRAAEKAMQHGSRSRRWSWARRAASGFWNWRKTLERFGTIRILRIETASVCCDF